MFDFIETHQRKVLWSIVALICVIAAGLSINVWDESGYAFDWGGRLFKALSGGAMGWLVSRYVLALDLSAIDDELRPLAGLSQAILIGCFAIAVT